MASRTWVLIHESALKRKEGNAVSKKRIVQIVIDFAMILLLPFLMAYSLVGETTHEWLGIIMLMLIILHHVLNYRWFGTLFKGKYRPVRILNASVTLLLLVDIIFQGISGIMMSGHVFLFLNIQQGMSFARTAHLIGAYWGFVLMSVHVGLHWEKMLNIARKMFKKPSVVRAWTVRIFVLIIAGYGVYTFAVRDLGDYMLLKTQFVFFDYGEPIMFFLLDYAAMIVLFAATGYYLTKLLAKIETKQKRSRPAR